EAKRHNENYGIESRCSNALSLNRFVEWMNNFELEPGRLLDAQLWMEEVEETFAALDISENKTVEYVSYMLTGKANNWWMRARRNMAREITLEMFQQAFFREFFPDNMKQKVLQEYHTLQQVKMTIEEYETKLNRMVRFLPDIQRSQVYLGKRPASTVLM